MLYTAVLESIDSTWYTQTFTAGTLTLEITFYWNDVVQSLYDTFIANVQNYAKSNPLTDATGAIIRDYDFIDYVLAQDASTMWPIGVSDAAGWFQSLYNTCYQAQQTKQQLKEMLTWNISIVDGDTTYTSRINGGGKLTSDDGRWTLWFDSSKTEDSIGVNDLYLVTLNIEVAE